jgi:hypothetical protein
MKPRRDADTVTESSLTMLAEQRFIYNLKRLNGSPGRPPPRARAKITMYYLGQRTAAPLHDRRTSEKAKATFLTLMLDLTADSTKSKVMSKE